MINALHLIWIVPVVFYFGFFWAAVLSVGKKSDERNDNRKNGNE